MHALTQHDVTRIYEGFNEAYNSEPDRCDFPRIHQFCDTDNGVRLELNDDVARGYWELFRPNSGLLVCLTDGLYHRHYLQRILPRQDIVTLRFVLSGGLAFTFDDVGEVRVPQASASILYTKEDTPFDLSIDDGCHLSTATFHLRPDMLYKGFEINRHKIPEHLQDVIFGGALDKNLYNFPLSPAMMNNVLDMLNMPYGGARRRVFTEAKTAELICRLFQEIEDDFEATPVLATPARSIKDKVFEAQRILIENYTAPPTLADLSRRVGLNRTTFCKAFKDIFGLTVFEFCQEHRMNRARELLQDRNLSISQVAAEVGYEHATNFTAAFKKHFGFLPKGIRSF